MCRQYDVFSEQRPFWTAKHGLLLLNFDKKIKFLSFIDHIFEFCKKGNNTKYIFFMKAQLLKILTVILIFYANIC